MFRTKVRDVVDDEALFRFQSDDGKQSQGIPTYQKQIKDNEHFNHTVGEDLLGRSNIFRQHNQSRHILDPSCQAVCIWKRAFLVSCLISLTIDPLILYWPLIKVENVSSCIDVDRRLISCVTCIGSLVDLLYALNIAVKFNTAYVAPSTKVFGKGELVMDRKMIAIAYFHSDFFVDLAAALPLKQIVIWIVIPAVRSSSNIMVTLIFLIQYVYRMYFTYILSDHIIESTGIITKSAWGGTVYNLLLYTLASHIIGAIYYLLTVSRQATCWMEQCQMELIQRGTFCNIKYFDCDSSSSTDYEIWVNTTQVFANCDSKNSNITFNFGIFLTALRFGAVSSNFLEKLFYCLWWGFQQLTSAGQNLINSLYIGETVFSIGIAFVSLTLFALLVGNMQTYLQSITAKVEEWRLKQSDTEEWMSHRRLPHNLRERVRQFYRYKWLVTRGVEEKAILEGLPADIQRDIHRYICLDLVRSVSFFSEMDDRLIDAISQRLVPSLTTKGTYIIREGDSVTEMLFILHGSLHSSTTNGGKAGFYNSIVLKPGDFCGEELLTWALYPNSITNLPSSTRTVKTLEELEAFAFRAEDLKFVSSQFRRLHSKKLQDTFRYYSPNWRTWAVCLIQAAWHRYKRRKMRKNLNHLESFTSNLGQENSSSIHTSIKSATIPDSRSESRRKYERMKSIEMPKLQKPEEPDFSVDFYD